MPATDSPSERLRRSMDRLEDSEIPQADKNAIRAAAERSEKAKTTLESYIIKLVRIAEHTDRSLVELPADEIKAIIEEMGSVHEWSDSSYKIYESAAIMLAEHLGKDKSQIEVTQTEDNHAIDERNVLTPGEFHDIREATTNSRNKAMIDFLGFTGQRIRVLQALRIKDIDLDEGVWYMPPVSGLKDADKVGNKRPLLGSLRSIGEWIEQHPTGEPEDPLITPMPSAPHCEPGDEMSMKSMRKAIYSAAERAGIDDKPVNPHAFRHHFVTIAKKRYDMDDSTVKHILGHSESSNIMETTYRHLDDDHHVKTAQKALGIYDGDGEALAPPVCEACQRPIRPTAESCPTPGCDMEFEGGETVSVSTTTGNPKERAREFFEENEEEAVEAFVDGVDTNKLTEVVLEVAAEAVAPESEDDENGQSTTAEKLVKEVKDDL